MPLFYNIIRKEDIVIRISKILNREEIQKGLDFLDVDTETDAKLFVDPTLLTKDYEKIVFDFTSTVYLKYSQGKKSEALNLFVYSKECNATHLGFSSGKSKGTGVSKKMLDQFFTYVMNANEHLRKRLLTPVAFTLFIKNFSQDRMSDLLISILKKDLILYSMEQAKIQGLPISKQKAKFEYWNTETHDWDSFESEFVVDPDGEQLILLPKKIVNRSFEITPARYISSIFTYLQTLDENKDLEGEPLTKKELREKKITQHYSVNKDKSYIQDTTSELPELFEEYYKGALKFRDYKSLKDEELIEILTKNS